MDNRTIEEVRKNETKLINEIKVLEQQVKKQKEVIDKIENLLIIKKARCLNEDNYILNVSDLDTILNLVKEVSE